MAYHQHGVVELMATKQVAEVVVAIRAMVLALQQDTAMAEDILVMMVPQTLVMGGAEQVVVVHQQVLVRKAEVE